MGHYFILDRSATFAVTIQEALEERGHSAEIYQDPLDALAGLTDFGADVLILDLGLGILSEQQLMGTFRGVPETRSLPIVGLAENTESSYTVEVLRLGLSDVLPRNLPLEELMARLTRSAGRPTVDLPMMQGRLAHRQLVDFLEYIRHMGKSGTLQVTSKGGAGRIDIRRGAVAVARFRNLRGKAAVLAMLDQVSGKFKLEEALEANEADLSTRLDLQTILLRAVWLSDKLSEYEQWVPRSGHELALVPESSLQELDEAADTLPVTAILETAQEEGSVRLHDLEREIAAAPQELRLALALLTKKGVLKLKPADEFPSTKELRAHMGVEFSVLDLLQRARHHGHEERSLSLMLVVEPEAWPSLRQIFEPLRDTPFGALGKLLHSQDHGSVSVDTEAGRLVLHLHKFSASAADNIKELISVCDGLLLWLGGASDQDVLRSFAGQLPSSPDAVRGVAVGAEPQSVAWCNEVLSRRPEWLVCQRPPSRLNSLLRCFFSRAN